jgi:hypothetical protein
VTPKILPVRLLLFIPLLLLTSCPAQQSGRSASKPRTSAPREWKDGAEEHAAGMALSLFRETPLETSPPDAISFSQDGSILWAHGLDRVTNEFYARQFDVDADRLQPRPLDVHGPDLIVNYIQSSPDGEEALVLSQFQPKGQTVRDMIYRVGTLFGESLKWRSVVPWQMLAGLPTGANETTFLFTKPFYSWDGGVILVPFNNDTGIGVIDKRTGTGDYVPYPATEIGGGWAGNAFGPLPPEGDRQQIWASFWRVGAAEDQCEVYTLDLQSLKWTRMFSLPWVVYKCAAVSPSIEPWLVSGSYSSLVDPDHPVSDVPRSGSRIPQLAKVTPGAGTVDLLPLHGEPIWELALDPLGGRTFYTDFQRKSLVRLDSSDGELDIDPRWFTTEDKETRLFISAGGDRCYVWRGAILIQAEFTKHEQLPSKDE